MSDRPQRSLRPRKPYPYLPPDTEDPDLVGYARMNFNKDIVSYPMELNANAKILVKFLNCTNKALRQFRRNEEEENEAQVRLDPPIASKNHSKLKQNAEGGRKIGQVKKDLDQNKKAPYDFKDPQHGSYPPKNMNLMEPSTRPKTQPNTNLMTQFGQYASLVNQIGSKGLTVNSKEISNFLDLLPRDHLEAASKAMIQQQMLLNQNNLFTQNRTGIPEFPNRAGRSREKENKLFGRSAYHVAIAYHIHLKKIKESGQELISSSHLDPTYCAQKLRGEKVRNGEMIDENR